MNFKWQKKIPITDIFLHFQRKKVHFYDGWFSGNEIVELREKNNEKNEENQQQQRMNVSIFG